MVVLFDNQPVFWGIITILVDITVFAHLIILLFGVCLFLN